ncbi:hypothetical protein QTP88_014792 [Uroleucon formosanum]
MDESYFFRPHRISTGSVYNDPYRKTMNKKKNLRKKNSNKIYKDHTGPFDGYNSGDRSHDMRVDVGVVPSSSSSRYYTTTQQVHLSVPLTPLTLSTTRFRQNHYAAPGGNSNTFFIVIVIINTLHEFTMNRATRGRERVEVFDTFIVGIVLLQNFLKVFNYLLYNGYHLNIFLTACGTAVIYTDCYPRRRLTELTQWRPRRRRRRCAPRPPEADNEDFHGSLGPLETGN